MPASRDAATEASAALAEVIASERLRIVAALIRRTGDWDLAEDSFHDAVTRALTTWPERGIPDSPGAWLTTVARNAATDAIRKEQTERRATERHARELEPPAEEEPTMPIDDDRLRLIFTCCHPALAMEARVALTLRTVLGLTVAETAGVFLVSEQTMQKRLVRARAKIRAANIPYRVPPLRLLPERTAGVLAVLYLLFSEGYASGSGDDIVRPALADEAIRLTRLVASLMPQQPEVLALLALQLFQHSRTSARLDADGELVLLDEQDRTLWDAAAIAEAARMLAEAETALQGVGAAPGPYLLQAQIAAEHATAPTAQATRFDRIAALYARLSEVSPSPVIDLNRAIAVALSDGPDAGLALLDTLNLDALLAEYHLLHATRADLWRRRGEDAEALPHYHRALALAPTAAERRFLQRRIDEIEERAARA
ncbi:MULTISPECIES: RNA polymerase sigma factor [unclassified Microcella]|uniref:RNA polymerase sigma factor n=1 Tax=unclassified Microcella TaxID=2630066 RepID=UPI0006F595F9|nr:MULTISPECIES: sigma-70 family RNA polymerase sigma factor [unclassified Microcella]KQV25205.1 RNA polymerase subunit sigma-24 [Yonghaparkia sp. Root332]KRF31487.1 RNA polymerase subunit sigma-24 [Yonghaparkia sp. Soil809]